MTEGDNIFTVGCFDIIDICLVYFIGGLAVLASIHINDHTTGSISLIICFLSLVSIYVIRNLIKYK